MLVLLLGGSFRERLGAGRRQARAIPRAGRGLPRLPHGRQEGRRALCGRPRTQDAFRNFLRSEYHPDPQAGSGAGPRPISSAPCATANVPTALITFPHSPTPSFTKISDGDLRDLWAYLRTLPRAPGPIRRTTSNFLSAGAFRLGLENAVLHPGPLREQLEALPTDQSRARTSSRPLAIAASAIRRATSSAAPKRDRFLAGGKDPMANGFQI